MFQDFPLNQTVTIRNVKTIENMPIHAMVSSRRGKETAAVRVAATND